MEPISYNKKWATEKAFVPERASQGPPDLFHPPGMPSHNLFLLLLE